MGVEHFAAKMSPSINILQGSEGSAVLQAIRFCLSSKFELTEERIELIRLQWQGVTEVTVTLHNTATRGLEYDRYGPSLTVKKVLAQQGATELQPISDAGQIISCDKAEVICLAYIVW